MYTLIILYWDGYNTIYTKYIIRLLFIHIYNTNQVRFFFRQWIYLNYCLNIRLNFEIVVRLSIDLIKDMATILATIAAAKLLMKRHNVFLLITFIASSMPNPQMFLLGVRCVGGLLFKEDMSNQ